MKRILITIFLLNLFAICSFAQANAFTYQGRLLDNTMPPTASYDFEFMLYDAITGGSFLGLRTRTGVQVTNGVFAVQLDFLPSSFDGTDRFLQINVKPAGSPGGFQSLLPRQTVTSAPYSFHSMNADTAALATNSQQLGGVAANQFVLTGDARLSDARPPTIGSGNYVQNRTSQQASASFNISGDGTVSGTLKGDIVNAITQYNMGGVRVFSTSGTNNIFAGVGAGLNNNGAFNSFFGSQAGKQNVDGHDNSFFGYAAGLSVASNTFDNSFFGSNSGAFNNGNSNSFFGFQTGVSNTSGDLNSFVGSNAGNANTTGTRNTFVGNLAGHGNSTGGNNTAVGAFADFGGSNLSFATAIGSGAVVNTSNTIVLGSSSETVIVPGKLEVDTLGTAGATQLCINGSNRIATCSSSLRYKTNLASYNSGLNLLGRLRPITFDWKEGGMHDFGLGAEDVEKVDPLLVTYNDKGQVEGVKYDRVGVVLINAVKEQQQQIERQQTEIENLKRIVCLIKPEEKICQK